MLDFTAALYLGLRHSSASLPPWEALTTGVPAALAPPPGARAVARRLAALQGCAEATLAPSTLHVFWDLITGVAADGTMVYMDGGVYPIARWGVERAAAHGVPVRTFPHHEPGALRQALRSLGRRGDRPLVVADGFCPGCGRSAPVAAYLEEARACGGLLVLDDTQALGIFGQSPRSHAPYGRGGGGSLRWHDLNGDDVLLVSSLAKGFGVPVAVLSGSRVLIRQYETASETRVHCSPPSGAAVSAAERALAENEAQGDALRRRLALLVRRFRSRLARTGVFATGGLFPVQTLRPIPDYDSAWLHERLLRVGVRTVLHRARNGLGARVSFILNAGHRAGDVDRAVDAVAENVDRRRLARSALE